MKRVAAALLLFVPFVLNAREPYPITPNDKPFTIESEFAKQKKRYKDISIAQPVISQNVRVVNDVIYNKIGKRKLKADLFLPNIEKADQSTPLVILIHGGGWRSGDKSLDHPMAITLANSGIPALCIEYRLSYEALYPASILDISSAIEWSRNMAKKYKWNPNSIFLLGSSAGGQMASLLGSANATYPKFLPNPKRPELYRVRGVINIDGLQAFIHPQSQEGQDKPDKPSAATMWFGKPLSQDSVSRIEASAITHVNTNSASFLFVRSGQSRFHAGDVEMREMLRQYKITYELYETTDTPHTFWLFNPWFEPLLDNIIEFIKAEK
ncbi:MAG: alpha/beta hydrolase fold domain-containing protein [Bacteroidales bacterium]